MEKCLLLSLILLFFHFPSFSSSSSFNSSLCHHDESFALLQFKYSFTIDTYYSCDGSPMKTATWKNGTDCCSWHGVTCDTVSGHVIGLNLGCEGFQGILHPNSTLFNIVHLQTLNLSNNDFDGSYFDSKFGRFTSLTHLDLSNTHVGGEIPSQISYLSKLQSLHLSGHYELVWKETTLKRLVQNATSLRELFLDYSDMSSLRHNSMDAIFNQSSLISLDLTDCELQGPIPPSFSNLTRLTFLSLARNNLNGSIPSSFSNLQNLIHLYLSGNSLSGQIPDVFGRMTKLQVFYLDSNKLEGQIPSSLFNLTQLVDFGCAYNKLEGPLHNKIAGFQKLIYLRLNDNLLNGTIPSSLLSLPSLVLLYLSNNQLTGPISEISSYSLEYLSLCNNKLQGDIPNSIFNLANLITLCLSSNNLSGVVNFQDFTKLQKLDSLSLSHNSQLSLNFEYNVTYHFSQLTKLDLSSLSLTEFPKLLGKLESLDLSNNKLNGTVSNWLLEKSRSLNLSQNLFTSIDQISRNNDQLGDLDLSFNLLVGNLSVSICNLSSLEFLNLGHNNFTGNIPQCLANLPSLQILDLQMNNFYGTLPYNFSKSSDLITLNLNDNQLEGYFPKSLSHCENLQVLNLRNNKMEDKFPVWLQTLQYLKVLVLRDNKLHGHIANLKIKHPFPSLVIFDISGNNFTGPLPKAYLKYFEAMKKVTQVKDDDSLYYMRMTLSYHTDNTKGNVSYYDSVTVTTKGIKMTLTKIPTMFVSIDLSRNKFGGEIPDVIGELDAVIGLNLSHNRLTGHIPQSIGKLTNLESFDLSSNMLTGMIPAEITNLNSLEVLDLSNNHLVGEIPQGKQFNTFTNDSYEGNLGLCGLPLSKKCGQEQHSQPSASNFWSEDKSGFGWKPVAIGYGCGFVIGIGIGYYMFLIGKPRWLVIIFGGHPKRRVNRRTRVRRNNGPTMNQMVQMS